MSHICKTHYRTCPIWFKSLYTSRAFFLIHRKQTKCLNVSFYLTPCISNSNKVFQWNYLTNIITNFIRLKILLHILCVTQNPWLEPKDWAIDRNYEYCLRNYNPWWNFKLAFLSCERMTLFNSQSLFLKIQTHHLRWK